MEIDSSFAMIIVSASPAVIVWGLLLWKLKIWKKIMDTFKEGLPFEKALEELKEGKSIRRKRSNYGFTRMIVSARGQEEEKFCEFDLQRNNSLRENPSLKMEDIMAHDWVVED